MPAVAEYGIDEHMRLRSAKLIDPICTLSGLHGTIEKACVDSIEDHAAFTPFMGKAGNLL